MPDAPTNHTVYLTKPILLGELFTESWRVFAKHWRSITLLTIVVSLPINFLTALATPRTTLPTDDPGAVFEALRSSVNPGMGVTLALLSLVGILIPLGIVAIVRAGEKNEALDVQTALGMAAHRWRAGVITALLLVVFLIGLAILLVIPAIIYGVFWAFAMYAVMHDSLQGKAALAESKRVVRGYWWKVLGNLLAVGIVAGIAGSIVAALFNGLPDGTAEITIQSTISSIASSYTIVAGYLLYRNLKAVHDPSSTPRGN